ncbi:MAG TPA: alpha/beta hydrolase [Chthoniobacterales bacterium]|jgi:pimeloyl-ACP methyl ester carboxylesterase|nr:alpha/beta hydrolase [Chthoniobacterales bacterium]
MRTAFEKIELHSGTTVAVSEYGLPSGAPVFFCHGWPSSRTMAELTDAAARELNLRIISPDRPGIRDSSLQPDRKLLDWPPLLAELADQMGIATFRILGISGGAPYALVAAWALPERVSAIAVVSGAPPLADLTDRSGLLALYRWLLFFYPRHRGLLRFFFHAARPFLSLKLPIRLRPLLLQFLQPCDANVMRDVAAFEACFESQRQAWRASADGLMVDAEIYAQPWGFPLGEIRVPVRLWHGRKDRSFHWQLAQSLGARLPYCSAHLVDQEGHYSLPIRHMREILEDLRSA